MNKYEYNIEPKNFYTLYNSILRKKEKRLHYLSD